MSGYKVLNGRKGECWSILEVATYFAESSGMVVPLTAMSLRSPPEFGPPRKLNVLVWK